MQSAVSGVLRRGIYVPPQRRGSCTSNTPLTLKLAVLVIDEVEMANNRCSLSAGTHILPLLCITVN